MNGILLKLTINILLITLLMVAAPVARALDASHYAAHSVLSSGRWVKVSVDETGIYSITNAMLSRWGFSDPSSVKVFGYGGAPVSTTLDADQIDDLPQVPVLRTGDGLLFYAQGPTTWQASNLQGMDYVQYQHPYATAGYYFITDRSDVGEAALATENTPLGNGGTVSTFTGRTFHESELFSPGETGHYLLGEDFRYTTTQTFNFDLAGIVEGTDVSVLTSFAAAASGRSSLSFRYNGNALASTSADNISALFGEYTFVNSIRTIKQFELGGSDLDFSVAFAGGGSVSIARLDYITVNYTRRLDMGGLSQLPFSAPSGGSPQAVYALSGSTQATHIWDVTVPHRPVEVTCTAGGGGVARFTPSAGGAREYVAFNDDGTFPTPTLVGSVDAQDLHAEATPDMIIITPGEFIAEARRVAALHEQVDSMRVLVVDHSLIFNEFSSGTPDVMAYRKLAKMFYDRGTDGDGHRLGYVLLFGRPLYDNRNITAAARALDYPRLLIWESATGLDDNSSFCTDDILGTLSDGSNENNMYTRGMEIAVGRMPVKSLTEAADMVDKLVEYVTGQDYGSWKNNVIVLADDEDDMVHAEQSESCVTKMMANGGEDYVYNRIYLDAYRYISDGSGNNYPDARQDMFKLLNDGALVFNYVGHGSPVGWSHEHILVWDDINNGLYYNHIPFVYTATCEFTRVDASAVSGGELMFLNRRGGAIALYTTTRQAIIAYNGPLTEEYGRQLFARGADGQYQRIGDIYRLSKNAHGDSNKLRFILIGDPAMRLGYPTYKAVVETINGMEPTEDNMPEFKARQTMTVRGSIYDDRGNKATTFTGAVYPTLYGPERSVETNDNHNEGKKFVYQERSDKLAMIKDSVNSGEFVFHINIPSEISADNYRPAQLSLYAYSNDGREANGSNGNFYIYGYDDTAGNDTIGPEIRVMYLNNDDFADGGEVNESPMLIAEVYDRSGLNFSTAGIGHQMTLQIDGTTTLSDVSSYFTPEIDPRGGEGSGGHIYYPLEGLASGYHTLRLKVWDTFANSSERTISFNVVNGLTPKLYEVSATPNPASTEARFLLRHNRPDASITVTIYVYNLMGQLVWSETASGRSDMFESFPIVWDLTDMAGRRVPRGVYVYRAGISTDGVQETTESRKIAVTAAP